MDTNKIEEPPGMDRSCDYHAPTQHDRHRFKASNLSSSGRGKGKSMSSSDPGEKELTTWSLGDPCVCDACWLAARVEATHEKKPATAARWKNSRQIKLGPQFSKWQVNFVKLLKMTLFSTWHFVLGVDKLQQMGKKKCQSVSCLT
jgi:hypothetical protein